MKMNDRNEYFFNCFEERLKFIKTHCLDRIEGLILICCCLDALGGYCYRKRSNFKLFREFIIEYSGRKEIWTKISLPLLKEYFEHNNQPRNVEFMRKLGVNEKSYLMKDYNTDINIDEIESKATKHIITPFSDDFKREILDFEYVRILWLKYRNPAIHEMKSNPDGAANIFEQSESVYYNHQTISENYKPIGEKINIDIPQPFLFKTLTQCLRNFRKHLEINNISLV